MQNTADYVKTHTLTANVSQNGYLYVYCSDESNLDVYFDNLQVMHNKGPILEETHYYPFGLAMSGISSSATDVLKNKYKFGGKEFQSNEFSDNSGLELYDFAARSYDPQIGSWWSNDPKADKYLFLSPYNYVANNPLKFIDPDGKEIKPVGTAAEIKQINNALNIIAKTNPEAYKALKEAKQVFTIKIGELVKKEANLETGAKSNIDLGGQPEHTDQLGCVDI